MTGGAAGEETFIVGTDRFGGRQRMRLRDMTWSDVVCAISWVEDLEPDPQAAARLRELVGGMLPKRRPRHLPEAVRRFWRGGAGER